MLDGCQLLCFESPTEKIAPADQLRGGGDSFVRATWVSFFSVSVAFGCSAYSKMCLF